MKYFVVFFTSFLLGFYFSLYSAQNNIFGMGNTSEKSSLFQVDNEMLDMTQFWEVYSLIESEYFTDTPVEKNTLVQGAIEGMVGALGDEHSEFLNPEMTEKFNESLSGDFEGIGAVVEKVPVGVQIERIIKGAPAKKYGLRQGDIIISANDTPLQDLDIFDAIEYIKGPAGTSVDLEIIRNGEESIIDIQVIREKIKIPSVEQEYFEEENIAYISLNLFGDTTAIEFREALENVKKSNADGLILDVRDNGGGYLQSAVEILSEFIPERELLVQTRYNDASLGQNYYSYNSGEIFDKKIVVLINGNSASASEITAETLREYNKAILVGEKTYGKGSVQQPFEMEDGSLLKLTVARWFSPDGKNFDTGGIEPDISVEFLEEDFENTYDRQLEEAKKLLNTYIEYETIGLSLEQYKNISKINE